MLVFFDDIIMYNKSWKDRIQHVDRVLNLFEEKKLYAKTSKFFFGLHEMEYLGHIVSHEGVKVGPKKIKVSKEWKLHKTIKQLQGLLGLTGIIEILLGIMGE